MKNLASHAYEETQPSENNLSEVNPDMRVAFILLNKFTLAPVTGLVESLRFAADQSFRSLQIYCKWDWMTVHNTSVIASCGLSINPTKDFVLEDLKKNYDYVVIAGGLLSETRQPSDKLIQAIQNIHLAKIPIIALCSACFVLGKAGILDQRKCAVHFTIRDEFVERFPNAIALVDKNYVEDNGIFTCPGGTAIDLAANLIRHHCGDVRAQKGLEYLLVNGGGLPVDKEKLELENPSTYINQTVARAIKFMSENLSAHVTLKEVAEYAKTNPRQLHRVFIANTNEPPANYWRRLRLEHARKLLANTSSYVTTIALECGFSDASHFILWFKKQYGETPFSYRKRRHKVERLN
ncbi:GlxA family transcriptional regulator [Acinetobacter pseudolwoffii]|uniref:GlxA family transcriptional regulator n=1 Tax=Acinetobacter pseudolwoffii TaxID=2053287 RepID=UPI002468AAA7|nr:helix-turn-helix domain-containing protein [Acinetobacter pseudolwoffii]MDH5818688.1 helix-turn-helix domain-containing protein [Acinetobacter pseudolwoffii]